jgi:hypothetical protein
MSDLLANETVTENTGTEREAAPSDAPHTKSHEAAERIVDSALMLGRLWARHGLTLGKLALETSATTLKTTADLLSAVADAVAPEVDETDETVA